MRLQAWGRTDVGLRREDNQDSILVDTSLGLFIVADGMGGHKGGEVASRIAVETLHEIISSQAKKTSPMPPAPLLVQSYEEASARIHHTSSFEKPNLVGMGTTLVVGLVRDDKIYIANVGDSRAYLFHSNCLWQITEDHSLAYEYKKASLYKDAIPAGKNIITRSVGYEREVLVDIVERKFRCNEMFVFCSDGLTGNVSDQRISEILLETPVHEVADCCVEEAKKGGGDDNISVILLCVEVEDSLKQNGTS